MADENLAQVVLRCMAVLAKSSSALASNISRSLPRFIVQGGLNSRTAAVAAECLAFVLKLLSQDAIITTLYSLGNVLSASTGVDGLSNPLPFHDSSMSTHQSTGPYDRPSTGSAISLALSDSEETSVVYGIVVQAIVGIASSCKDDKITALAISMLIQKFGRVNLSVDAKILAETAILGVHCGSSELRSLLKLYSYLSHNALIQHNSLMLAAVLNARNYLSRGIKKGSPLYEIYLVHLLDAVIRKGDARETENSHVADVDLAAKEITQLLEPLAILVSLNASSTVELQDSQAMLSMQRDAWFNIVVHGFSPMSPLGKKHLTELKILAQYSHPLVAEERADQVESDIELNTVLRRGMNPNHMAEQKRQLTEFLPSCEADIRGLSYTEVVFLSAANLVAHLQARAGDPTKTRLYFLDPKLRSGAMGSCMNAIAISAVDVYLSKTLAGHDQIFSTPYVAQQLATFFAGCCHRISRVQHVSIACTDRIISQIPSALCQKSSLFALLELLTIMWTSCLEAETDQYESKSIYSSSRGNVSVELSDDYEFRRFTLVEFHKRAKGWVGRVMDVAPLDVKGLLQTYLSEYDDEGVYGHVSLGRSFALEMGSAIVSTDQRLGAIDDRQRGLNINTASDFIAQYTTRQEYRYADAVSEDDREWLGSNVPARRTDLRLEQRAEDAMALLRHLESRTLQRVPVSIAELRDALKRAASLLCRADRDHGAIVHHLVGIPFTVFTKQSIKLGISLWMGVIKENPRMESRLLCEIAASWENTIRKKLGLFNERFQHLDPFYVKEEFAPTDKDTLMKRQQLAHNLTAPHFRLLQFLSSHFNATRLCNPYVERAYHRLMRITLSAMKHTTSQPLAREVHFHVVLLGLRILRHSTSLDTGASWRLKDQILSAGLVWFYRPPSWSFGSNKIQMRAEVKLLADVAAALQTVAAVGTKPTPSLVSLQSKQDLLLLLLGNEQTRLAVWLLPFGADQERKHHFLSGGHDTAPAEAALSALLRTAWGESPALAVQLTTRFQSPRLASDVRWQVLNSPEKVLGEPDALHVLLGTSMPTDVSFQLKYLLYWAPVNPITAVTYFLPAYGNHPFIIQYAMRALESHSVDVTFFYVPQIVQTLRYDVLGYVKRYIIETAKFSQLFAHQIIWNMKANAFKDEDSQVPDPVKPTLDKVMEALINSFSGADKSFYEREFTFFNEVTDISGKLRPFIKRPKPEKKQKIEEELRKIQVEVGIYLPSNPDGVVVGIDRKSGKPLQSHAKAPYMATFRIRKEKGDMEAFEKEVSEVSQNGTISKETTYEVWQSAIFKVGDDCRQDVLALQMIAAFRGIFNSVGLDVYVFPYRVTATAPGCGVIDVLPNSISRDMLGREAVNGLYDYFVSKYGGEDSLRFQEARGNFVKSMAAYSVISYLLQFKDRHNGNIMIDDAGHILHIDFGFCFDIAPGGVRFERAPFKLTAEMVAVMGGSTSAQPYRWFEELCVKSFLAVRPYVEALSHLVIVMLDSGLPCFKPQTIQHFKERFVPQKTERDAADFMRGLVDKSYRSYSTKGYDQFQLLTNGIPY
ncbi:hypothetical protein B0A49_03968 [Cryomyces minteri]|uniref:1-phosphatidylinositol 4-kinase n=1 Tax=Cryomyces minteri TaxID=331657 RepID=A0A4U0XLB0_9PEZI|nr:hypothetical protein B0A49_03968 [Cryomyces minteri]